MDRRIMKKSFKELLSIIGKLICNKRYRTTILAAFGFYDQLDDEEYIKRLYYAKTGKHLDLNNPQTFNEKLQWLKLHDRNPKYTVMSDKILAKEYVAEIIGRQYIVPTIGVWDNPEEIDFDKLPNRFVLKCNHNSGLGMCVCKDKASLNYDFVRQQLRKGLNENHYKQCREWPYRDIPRRILAEEYLEDGNIVKNSALSSSEGLIDYKFYCFNGKPKFLYVGFANIVNGIKKDQLTFLTLDWKPAEFYREDHEPFQWIPSKPKCFQEMVDIASTLSRGIPFERVDLYCINEKIYFSEFTFYPGGGYGILHPLEWEEKIGKWIDLSIASGG